MMVEPVQAELGREGADRRPVRIPVAAGINRHIGATQTAAKRLGLRRADIAQPADFNHKVFVATRHLRHLGVAPIRIGYRATRFGRHPGPEYPTSAMS